MDIQDRIEFWDLIRKVSFRLDEIDCAIIVGVLRQKSYTQIAKTLRITARTVYNRRRKIRAIIGNFEKSVSGFAPKT